MDRKPHDVARLESNVKSIQKALRDLAQEDDFIELIKHFHQPGWTTPAEFMLVSGVIDQFAVQVKTLAATKQLLLEGSKAVLG